jgi:hypothetical protein
MAGLLDQAGKQPLNLLKKAQESYQAWEESMLSNFQALKESILSVGPEELAFRCAAEYKTGKMHLEYWGEPAVIFWPDLDVQGPDGSPLTTFDKAMIMYYLSTADGVAMADRWIGFRELPDGGFYNQAFQGYSGDRLARAFGDRAEQFHEAAAALGGFRLPALAEFAWAFQALPRIRLATVLWPGDEEFASKGSVLFDAASSHYMPTDGLALLGSGLVRRLEKAIPS